MRSAGLRGSGLQSTGLRFLLPYMRPYRGHLIRGTVYAILGAGASAFSPTVLGWAVDELNTAERENRLVRLDVLALYALGLLGLAGLLALFRYLLRMLTGEIAAGVSYQMSRDLFNKLLLFSRASMQEYGVGDLLSRATSDFIYIWRFYSAGFQMSMHALLLLLIGTALMAWSNLLLAGLVLVMLTVSLTAQFRLSRALEGLFTGVQREMGVLSAFTQEHLASARMLAVYNQEAPAVATFRHTTDRYTRRNLDFLLRSAVISPLPALFVRLAQALVLLVGGTLIIQDRLTLGQYTTFVVYLGLLNSAAMQLSGAYERLLQGSAAAGRIGEILHRGTRVSDAPDAGEPPLTGTLRFEGVGVREGRHWVLRQIDVEVPAGTTLGIVGATGAGKSTLLGLVGRIRDPDEGRVTIDGHDVRRITLAALRRAVVYVPQETLLFSMPLRDNITLGLDGVPDERVQAAARVARLTGDLTQLPRGLDTIVGERGASLSGGQKQRTAIARAIVRDPRILLMDDSLSAVDTETAAGIIAELRAGAANTRLIVSQRLAAVRDAEQIIVLDEGRIVERGTHASLLQDDGLYAAMYRREAQQAADELDEDRAAADD